MTAEAAVTEAFRNDWGSVVGHLIRITGDWDLAEECAQDAFAKALERWPRDGVPSSPVAWLKTTARNRAIDRLRRDNVGAAKLQEVALTPTDLDVGSDDSGVGDDRLRLMFTCCHPALALEAQVALTLRTLAGLTTVEIARAFMVPQTRWPSDSYGPNTRSAMRASPIAFLPLTCCRTGRSRCSRCSTDCSTRGTARPPEPTKSAKACATKPSVWPSCSPADAGRSGSARSARADAVARRRAAARGSTKPATS